MSVIRTRQGRSASSARRRPENWSVYLDSDEELLWQGGPSSGLRFRTSDIFTSLFGAAFMAFAAFWIFMAKSMTSKRSAGGFSGGPDGIFELFPLFGVPFVAVGIYLLVGRYFWKAFIRGRTSYALTSKRAIIKTRVLNTSVKFFPISAATKLEYVEGDWADIWFHKEQRRGSKGRSYTVKKGFEYIPDGDRVYRLMRKVQQDDRRPNR